MLCRLGRRRADRERGLPHGAFGLPPRGPVGHARPARGPDRPGPVPRFSSVIRPVSRSSARSTGCHDVSAIRPPARMTRRNSRAAAWNGVANCDRVDAHDRVHRSVSKGSGGEVPTRKVASPESAKASTLSSARAIAAAEKSTPRSGERRCGTQPPARYPPRPQARSSRVSPGVRSRLLTTSSRPVQLSRLLDCSRRAAPGTPAGCAAVALRRTGWRTTRRSTVRRGRACG